MGQIVQELRQLMLGWRAFFGFAEGRSPRRDHGQPWGRQRYRELRKRGVDRPLAWNTITSAHGQWRLSQSRALALALPRRSFAALELPSLIEGGPTHRIR